MDLTHLPNWIQRGAVDLFPNSLEDSFDDNLIDRIDKTIKEDKKLRVKLGIDPTGTEIHIGHSILFRKLRAFQDNGHTAVLIIGDFTAKIGDPTGKNSTRKQLNNEEVNQNSQNYLEQLGMGKNSKNSLLDFSTPGRIEIRRNSDWLAKLDLEKIITLLSNSTVGQMLAKDDFNKRYKGNTPIALHEFLYPLLQGYDSVAVNSDIELGGTDQKFNIGIGRDLQKVFNKKQQFGLLLPILNGTDGLKKMSKTEGNTIGISEDALSMYSKLEKIPDAIVPLYINLLTDLQVDELPKEPREIQRLMALTVTKNFHGEDSARIAQRNAEKVYLGDQDSLRQIPEISLQHVQFPAKLFYLLGNVGLFKSTSEARRTILGGGIKISGKKLNDPNIIFKDKSLLVGQVLQVGKKIIKRFID
tara:strand:- start:4037 stop:5278 length:1242 start_codon:yes stop_codon:yes gene_type:complete